MRQSTSNKPAVAAIARCGRTQTSIAKELGIQYGVLNQVLNGHKPSWPRLRRDLAAILDVSVAEIFPDDESQR